MSVWNLLREFRIRKVHMAVVLNEYGGTVGVCIIFMHWNFTVSYSFLFHIGIRRLFEDVEQTEANN